MKIIIIGCGKVGVTLGAQLAQEEHDVVLIDESAARIQGVPEEIDAIKLVGNGASIAVQTEAGVETADIMIAVTGSDELNLLCCVIAKKAGNCHTIARVRNPVYYQEIGFIQEKLGISMILNPELAAANEISRILRFPSAIKIDPFAKGRAELVKFKVQPEFRLDGLSVMDIDSKYHCDVLISGVERGDEVVIPDGKYVIHDGDIVSIMAAPRNSMEFFKKIGVLEKAYELRGKLGGFRVKVDDSDKSPGWKFSEQEMRGIPLRVEIGPKDIEAGKCIVCRRDTGEKLEVPLAELEKTIAELLTAVQRDMLAKARHHLEEHTYTAASKEEFEAVFAEKSGFVKAMWCGEQACEDAIKESMGVTSRCMPFEQETLSDTCVCCGKKAKKMVYWGKAY